MESVVYRRLEEEGGVNGGGMLGKEGMVRDVEGIVGSETTLEVGKGEGKVGEMGSRSGGEMKEAGSRERGVDEGH